MEQPEYNQNIVNDIQGMLNAEYNKFHTLQTDIQNKIDNLHQKKQSIEDDLETHHNLSDEIEKYHNLSDEIEKLDQEKSKIGDKKMAVRVEQERFKKLINRLINKHGDDKSKWHSDVLDLINKYKKHNFLFPMPRNRASISVQLSELPEDGYFDGGKRRKTKTKTKTKRSKIIGARCCTRRSRRISCRRGETALRRQNRSRCTVSQA